MTYCCVIKGTLDIMVQRTGEQGEGNILFIQNNFYYDAFFLKAIGEFSFHSIECVCPDTSWHEVLNGACGGGMCKSINGSGTYQVRGALARFCSC